MARVWRRHQVHCRGTHPLEAALHNSQSQPSLHKHKHHVPKKQNGMNHILLHHIGTSKQSPSKKGKNKAQSPRDSNVITKRLSHLRVSTGVIHGYLFPEQQQAWPWGQQQQHQQPYQDLLYATWALKIWDTIRTRKPLNLRQLQQTLWDDNIKYDSDMNELTQNRHMDHEAETNRQTDGQTDRQMDRVTTFIPFFSDSSAAIKTAIFINRSHSYSYEWRFQIKKRESHAMWKVRRREMIMMNLQLFVTEKRAIKKTC